MLYPLSYGGGTSASDPREHPRRKGIHRLDRTQTPGMPKHSAQRRPKDMPELWPHRSPPS